VGKRLKEADDSIAETEAVAALLELSIGAEDDTHQAFKSDIAPGVNKNEKYGSNENGTTDPTTPVKIKLEPPPNSCSMFQA